MNTQTKQTKYTPGPNYPGFFPTPGPWHTNGTQIIGKAGKRTQYVADVSRDNGVMIARDNARLIAAAPELLDRLDELCGILDVYADYWQNNQGRFGDILDSLDNARAAIAKARGEA